MRSPEAQTAAEDPTGVYLERWFDAPRERVFRAITDPARLPRWWHVNDAPIRVVALDVRPGGAYALEYPLSDGTIHHLYGTYVVVEPPARLEFTWQWTAGPDYGSASRVSMVFEDHGPRTCLLLTHKPFATAADAAKHERGWNYLAGLWNAYLQQGDTP